MAELFSRELPTCPYLAGIGRVSEAALGERPHFDIMVCVGLQRTVAVGHVFTFLLRLSTKLKNSADGAA